MTITYRVIRIALLLNQHDHTTFYTRRCYGQFEVEQGVSDVFLTRFIETILEENYCPSILILTQNTLYIPDVCNKYDRLPEPKSIFI